MADDESETEALLARAALGDISAWGAVLAAHEQRLMRMVTFRMDARLRGRIDPADVVQDAFVEASAHRADYFRTPDIPLFLWLRGVVNNKLLEVHRQHLKARMRDAKRELPMDAPRGPNETSAALCAGLTAGLTRPSRVAMRNEIKSRLSQALGEMDATDREVLALRHFEQLTSAEAAQVLGIQERAAAKRYLRALKRLKKILSQMPGGLTELRL